VHRSTLQFGLWQVLRPWWVESEWVESETFRRGPGSKPV